MTRSGIFKMRPDDLAGAAELRVPIHIKRRDAYDAKRHI